KVATLGDTKRLYHAVAMNLDGKALISGSTDGTMRVWDLATGNETHRFETSLRGGVTGLAPVANSTCVACSTWGPVLLWDSATDKHWEFDACHWNGPGGPLAVSPDGQWLACEIKRSENGETAAIHFVNGGKPPRKLGRLVNGVQHWGLSFAFSPDSKILATAS